MGCLVSAFGSSDWRSFERGYPQVLERVGCHLDVPTHRRHSSHSVAGSMATKAYLGALSSRCGRSDSSFGRGREPPPDDSFPCQVLLACAQRCCLYFLAGARYKFGEFAFTRVSRAFLARRAMQMPSFLAGQLVQTSFLLRPTRDTLRSVQKRVCIHGS